jgi:hypothetical protein
MCWSKAVILKKDEDKYEIYFLGDKITVTETVDYETMNI